MMASSLAAAQTVDYDAQRHDQDHERHGLRRRKRRLLRHEGKSHRTNVGMIITSMITYYCCSWSNTSLFVIADTPAKAYGIYDYQSSSNGAWTRALEIRGGGWRFRNRRKALAEETTIEEEITINDNSNSLDKDKYNNDNNHTILPSASSWSSPLSSLFQAHNQLKAQAALDEAKLPRKSTYKRLAQPPASNRGGAMVAIAKPKSALAKWRRRVPSWLAPLESSLVSSWTAQWVAMDEAVMSVEDIENHEYIVDEPTSQKELKEQREVEEMKDGSRRSGSLNRKEQQAEERAAKHEPATFDHKTKSLADAVRLDDEVDDEDDEDDGMDEELLKDELHDSLIDAASLDETATASLAASGWANMTASLYAQNFSMSTSLSDTDNASSFVSSGYWGSIDRLFTFGLAETHPGWRVSRKLRRIRKMSARVTGVHGLLSGKPSPTLTADGNSSAIHNDDASMGAVRRRLAAISRARDNLAKFSGREVLDSIKNKRPSLEDGYEFVLQQTREEKIVERLRKERVREIDQLMIKSQKLLQDLACEKDVLQRRPNPLWNYTADENVIRDSLSSNESEATDSAGMTLTTSREFSFPPSDLVDDYLDMLFSSGRIVKLNHTDLWRNSDAYFDDDEDDDELSSPRDDDFARHRSRTASSGSGSWLLRNGFGEKIGEAAETAGYKAVCQSVMSVLARGLSSLHGVNLMKYSDIALSMESGPDLPPLAAGIITSSGKSTNYAQGAIERAMTRGARKRKASRRRGDFIQRDAVVETLLSHCQISAPLLTLFPIAWQRALLGNIITLVAAVIADFFEGVELQILGHRLSFSFKPISESDMLRHFGTVGDSYNRRNRASQEQFEAAVHATATDLAENLKFLDRWHERALGSGMLRQQIAHLIARVVLTLADDVLSSARMDLWTAQAGGPRLIAGLEFRQ